MDTTIVIRINQKEKLATFMAFLKSIDYISSVELFDKYLDFKKYLEAVNTSAGSTDLPKMTLNEVNEEIKAYRSGK